MSDLPILIVGAGPTGLVLALSLARRGVRFRIIDDNDGPGEHSRALAIHARTLEFYRQFGFADEIVSQGIILAKAQLRTDPAGNGGSKLTIDFGEIGGGISPYPFILTYPQDDHERFLVARLHEAGVEIERNVNLAHFVQDNAAVTATLAHSDGRHEAVRANYLCGCDGARSRVRETLGIGFPGGTYDELFYVADVKLARGSNADLQISLANGLFTLMMPVRSSGMQRFVGLVPRNLSIAQDVTFEKIRSTLEPLLGVNVEYVNWFSTYRVHHRVAARFTVGRTFLLGDAGHVHSPTGGQGMNTGIGDAINLGWKLADVVLGRASIALLDSYEAERIGFARALVSTTDRAFGLIVGDDLVAKGLRSLVAPMITLATRFDWSRHAIFRTLSQTKINYANTSSLSDGKAGNVRGGERLPWTRSSDGDNFDPLRSLAWQVHVYGAVDPHFALACAELGLAIASFAFEDGAKKAGFASGGAYLVRPDGYVGLALKRQEVSKLTDYASRFGLRFTTDAQSDGTLRSST